MSTELFAGRLEELLICKVSGKTGWLNWMSKNSPAGIPEKMSHNKKESAGREGLQKEQRGKD